MTSAAQDSLHAIVQEDASGTQRVERPGHGDPGIITRSGGPEHGRELTRPRRKEVAAPVGSLGRTEPERG